MRDEYAGSAAPIVLSGNIGPRGDGYIAGDMMSINAARLRHAALGECEELDDGNPEEFGTLCRELKNRFLRISVFEG